MSAFPIPAMMVERLGWVLLHSLWQFALIALIAAVTVRLLKRNSATLRYGSVLAIGAADGSLLARVRRIVGFQSNRAGNSAWPALSLGVCGVVAVCVMSVFSWQSLADPPDGASQPKPDRYLAELPGGLKVEFVGLAPGSEDGTHANVWWKPDGRKLGFAPKYRAEPKETLTAAEKPIEGWGDPSNGLRARVVPVLSSMSEDAIDPAQRVTKFEKADDVAFVVELENVSDAPIKLLDTRYGDSYGDSKGKANSNWFGQFLFTIDLFDGDGQKIERPEVEVVDLNTVMDGALVASLEPGKTHRFLLRPAEWLRAMTQRIEPGSYGAAVTYHGLPARVATRIKEYRPDDPALDAVAGEIVSLPVAIEIESFNGKPKASANEPNEPPVELVWGEPTAGLRAAMPLAPSKASYSHGEKPELKLHVQNVSDKPITLASLLWLSELPATVTSDKGEAVTVGATWYTGRTLAARVTLKPQQTVVFDAGNVGLAITNERAGRFDDITNRTLVAPAGKYTMQLAGRFGDSFTLKDGNGKVLAPLEGDWIGELKTGVTPFEITNETIECDIVDAVTGKPVAGTLVNFRFIKPKSGDAAEETVSDMYWGTKAPSHIYFAIPDEVMRRADREEIEVQWGIGQHDDYEPFMAKERIPLKQFFKEGTKAARETLGTIKLTPKKKVGATAPPEGLESLMQYVKVPVGRTPPLDKATELEVFSLRLRSIAPRNWIVERNDRAFRLQGPEAPAGQKQAQILLWFDDVSIASKDLVKRDESLPKINALDNTRLGRLYFDRNAAAVDLWPEFGFEIRLIEPADQIAIASVDVLKSRIIQLAWSDAALVRYVEIGSDGRRRDHLARRDGSAIGITPATKFLVVGKLPNPAQATTEADKQTAVRHHETFKELEAEAARHGVKVISLAEFETYTESVLKEGRGFPTRWITDADQLQVPECLTTGRDLTVVTLIAANEPAVEEVQSSQATTETAPPKGLEFLKPYPKLHGLSLDMTEAQFLEIVKQQQLKARKSVDGGKTHYWISLGDDHTLIVMFDKGAKCRGIQRIRGDAAPDERATNSVQSVYPPLELRFAAQPANSRLELRVPADFEQRQYPDNNAISRSIAKDRGFVWVEVASSGNQSVRLPVDRERSPGVRIALLADEPEHVMAWDGKWAVEECRVIPAESVGPVELFSVALKLNEAGGKALRALNRSHLNQPLAVVVNGQIIAAPIVRDEIGRDIVITGNFTREQADKLVKSMPVEDKEAAADPHDQSRSGLVPGQFGGFVQTMRIDPDGSISYGESGGLCQMTLFDDEGLKVVFHNDREIWTDVTLPPVTGAGARQRASWSTEIDGYEYQATAIPFSTRGCVFRLEKRLDGKLVHGSLQFFAVRSKQAKSEPDKPAAPIDHREFRVDQSGTGVVAGRYTGASQTMQIAADGTVSYSDRSLGICHLAVLEDNRLTATFRDARGMPTDVTLPLVTTAAEHRASWSAEIDGHTLRATAVPYSDTVYVFAMEKLRDSKLIEGSQQFYAIDQKLRPATPKAKGQAARNLR